VKPRRKRDPGFRLSQSSLNLKHHVNGLEPQLVTNYRSTDRVPDEQNFRGAYNLSGASFGARSLTNEERRNIEDFGFSGRDPSRVGSEDPYLHPGG
jgi:hypothetical protein